MFRIAGAAAARGSPGRQDKADRRSAFGAGTALHASGGGRTGGAGSHRLHLRALRRGGRTSGELSCRSRTFDRRLRFKRRRNCRRGDRRGGDPAFARRGRQSGFYPAGVVYDGCEVAEPERAEFHLRLGRFARLSALHATGRLSRNGRAGSSDFRQPRGNTWLAAAASAREDVTQPSGFAGRRGLESRRQEVSYPDRGR